MNYSPIILLMLLILCIVIYFLLIVGAMLSEMFFVFLAVFGAIALALTITWIMVYVWPE